MTETHPAPAPSLARSAGTVMLAFILSQLTGLAAKILIGKTFTPHDVDAFLAANRPSEALVFVMTGGIFVSSFIPVFVKYLVKEDRLSAWKLASAIVNWILVIMILSAGLICLLAEPIVGYALTAWFAPEKQALTVDLLRIQSLSVLFFSLSGLLIGILNSHRKFLLSALAPAMYQLGQIFGVLILAPHMGVYGLAWGVVIGSLFNLLIQVPGLVRLKGRYFPTLGVHDAAVGEVLRLMAPRMFGAAVVQLMVWINTLLASRQEGAVYALSYGFSLMMMAQIAIAQSVATAVMPTFSTQYAQGRIDDLRGTLVSVIRAQILMSVPATAGLILLSVPIITFLYQRGEFTALTTQMVAWALVWYASGLVFHAIQEVLVRAYYAMHDTRTPVLVGAAAMLLSIAFSLLFSYSFTQLGWMPHGGLALAVSVSTALEVLTLLFLMRKRLHGLQERQVAAAFGAALLGTAVMTAGLLFWLEWLRFASPLLLALGSVVVGASLYGLTILPLRLPEVHALFQAVKRRLTR